MIKLVDGEVDFRYFDYYPSYGKGIPCIITQTDIFNMGPFFSGIARATGQYGTEDLTSVDILYVDESKLQSKSIHSVAHEFSHFLGKMLITSLGGTAKDGWWTLPDEYLMGNVIDRYSLMGRLTNLNMERIHLDSYCKEWLGWLNYQNMTKDRMYTITTLTKKNYGDSVYRYSCNISKST